MGENLTIYTIYTSEDKASMLSVVDQLKSLEKQHKLAILHEDPIQKGQPWKPKTESEFKEADIFLLFVSNAFMHSEFVKQLEFKTVIDKYKDGSSTVIPILINDCPWDINFEADTYTFSFKELQVLPTDRKPIRNWVSPEKANTNVTASIKKVIASLKGETITEEPEVEEEASLTNAVVEDQIALSFDAEKELEEENKAIEEAEVKRKAEEQNKLKEEAEVKRKVEEEDRLKKEAETKNKVDQERKRREEAELKQKAEAQRLKAEVEAKRVAEERRLKEEAEAKRRAIEDKRFQAEVAAKRKAEKEDQQKLAADANQDAEEAHEESDSGINKRVLLILGVLLAAAGIWALSVFNSNAEKQSPITPENDTIETNDPVVSDETEIEPVPKTESILKLSVGDTYNGGMVFVIDSDGKNGKLVHLDDAGPMSWKNANIIHEQLGEGWRLPTFDELLLLYKTVGQGASNSAEFADELYWSATDYDAYQARLVRFRDGNTSYHYNKGVEQRRFRVRAIKDFSQ